MLLTKWITYGDNTITRNVEIQELDEMSEATFLSMDANLMIRLEDSKTMSPLKLADVEKYITIRAESIHHQPKKADKIITFYPENCHMDDFETLEAKKVLKKIERNSHPICFDGLGGAVIWQDDHEIEYKALRFNIEKCSNTTVKQECATTTEIDDFVNNLNIIQTGIFNKPTLGNVHDKLPYYKEHTFISNDLVSTSEFHSFKTFMSQNNIDVYDALIRMTL